MSAGVSESDCYSLSYPGEEGVVGFPPYSSPSPIDYNRYPSEDVCMPGEIEVQARTAGVTLADIEARDEGQELSTHPGPPWFRWSPEGSHPEYEVRPAGRDAPCHYIRYGVYNGLPYALGTDGVGQPHFSRELQARPRSRLEVSGVDDRELDLFVKDVPFNFPLEQALESLDDPGALAEVARLRTIMAKVPVYGDLAREVRELSEAVNKFQVSFNEKTRELVTQLEGTKRRMEDARLHSRTQAALIELAHARELKGRHYWPYIPGVLEDPGRHDVRELRTASTDVKNEGTSQSDDSCPGGVKTKGCISPNYRAIQRTYNVCRLCGEMGHWIRECETPHVACRGPFCQLRRDHAGFYLSDCAFPRRQVGRRGKGKRKMGPAVQHAVVSRTEFTSHENTSLTRKHPFNADVSLDFLGHELEQQAILSSA